ncbi:MAG: acyl-[ACP]--phospholipid O-acyltransferase [Bacteroidota bacterium]
MSNLFKIRGFSAYLLIAFLNAFTDLGHKIIIQNTVFKAYTGTTQIVLTALVNALILLPFVLLFTPTGFLSDKFPKDKIIKIAAAISIPLVCIITLSYYNGWFELAFFMTLLLGVQAAFYAPAKYGYIKELTGKENIPAANAFVQAVTIVAILAGTLVFSIFFEQLLNPAFKNISDILVSIAPLGYILIACSILETLLSLRLERKREENTALKFDVPKYVKFGYLRENLGGVRKNETIWLSIIGLSIFWGINQVVLAIFPEFLKDSLKINNAIIPNALMGLGGIGIVVGSIIAGRVSKNFIETGIVPIGAIGMTASLLLVPNISNLYILGAMFFIYGIMGGMFIIPLNSLIQFNASEEKLGETLAANNFMQNLVMLGFLGMTMAITSANFLKILPFPITSHSVFYILFAIALGGTIFTFFKLPQSFLRYFITTLISQKYKLSVIGMKNIPSAGGVLLLGNHVSYLDWAMLQIACPRSIRFVMARQYYKKWYFKKFLDLFGVIPISTSGSHEALKTIGEYLKSGEVVALFPEGRISRNGQLTTFQRGFEIVAKGSDAVIVPFYLHGLWGSMFSFATKKYKKSSASKLTRDITISFGAPMKKTSTAADVKQQVVQLSQESWDKYVKTLQPVHIHWLETAKKSLNDVAVVNFDGTEFTSLKLLTAAIAFSKRIKALAPDEQNIGLLLPTSSGGIIANLAVMMTGKTIANLNYTANTESLLHALNMAEIKTILTSKQFLVKLKERGFQAEEVFKNVTVHNLEDIREGISKATLLKTGVQVKTLPTSVLKTLHFKNVDPESTAAILFSSGSEGVPKGVELSHRNIMANVKQIISVLQPPDNEVVLNSLPIFHAFGLTVSTFMPLTEGIKCVCQADPTDALAIGKLVAKYKVTLLFGTSTFLGMYARSLKLHPLMFQSLRMVVAGAERLNEYVRSVFKEKFGHNIYEGYGTTETAPVASVNLPDVLSHDDWAVQVGSMIGTVGMPVPGTVFKIVDPETYQELPVGEAGLILISGPQVMKGYLNNPQKTSEVIIELDGKRWYKSGDKGKLNADGYLTILDRYSRFAKVGGEMVSLSALESNILNIIQQSDLELCAVPLPDANKGETITLLVGNSDLTPQGFKKRLLEGGLNPLMMPKAIINVDAIPKLGSGKTDFAGAKKVALELSATKKEVSTE